jgi:stage III sporulation protein SpoIIIAA
MSQRSALILTDVINTTNATPTASTTATYTPPAASGGYIEITATARISSGANVNNSGTVKSSFSFGNNAGTVTVGTANAIVPNTNSQTGLTTIALTCPVVGGVLTPTVTGVAATNIEWFLEVAVYAN